MQELKAGDRVRHKLANILMTITKISESVAVCRRDEPVFSKFSPNDPIYTAICKLENLEIISHQQ